MSREDLEKWEARYAAGEASAGEVAPFLVEIEALLPRTGRALDLAGGLGRNAMHFAERGLETTLLDISPRGLLRAENEAKARGLSIKVVALDLESDSLPQGPFDLVVCTWFLLAPAQWQAIAGSLSPEGRMVYVHPTVENITRHAHPGRRFLCEPEAVEAALTGAGFEAIRFNCGWERAGNHTARLLARLR